MLQCVFVTKQNASSLPRGLIPLCMYHRQELVNCAILAVRKEILHVNNGRDLFLKGGRVQMVGVV